MPAPGSNKCDQHHSNHLTFYKPATLHLLQALFYLQMHNSSFMICVATPPLKSVDKSKYCFHSLNLLYIFAMKCLLISGLALLVTGCMGNGSENHTDTITFRHDSLLNTTVQPNNALVPIDRSPMDMAYFPVDYPILKTSAKIKGMPLARVIYSRPHRQGRTIFGALVPFGQPWRLGANEATEIELFAPATIENKTVTKGRYILYCIPQTDKWTLVFNSNLYTWGLNPDSTKDVHRFTIPVVKANQMQEHFTMLFAPAAKGAELVIAWEQAEARLPIQFK